jgi:hypothetical protein
MVQQNSNTMEEADLVKFMQYDAGRRRRINSIVADRSTYIFILSNKQMKKQGTTDKYKNILRISFRILMPTRSRNTV